jgi:hypothetical protein
MSGEGGVAVEEASVGREDSTLAIGALVEPSFTHDISRIAVGTDEPVSVCNPVFGRKRE